MGLNDRLNSLIEEIKQSNEYINLVKTKVVIDKNSVLKNRLNDFNKRQGSTFDEKLSESAFEIRVKELDLLYNELIKIKEINDFMLASKKFDEVIGKVYKKINDGVNI
jgi:cell fate (sporulation/competence/biofilm development) regulator YlbF (YheA/YmcA/DUF963 family)